MKTNEVMLQNQNKWISDSYNYLIAKPMSENNSAPTVVFPKNISSAGAHFLWAGPGLASEACCFPDGPLNKLPELFLRTWGARRGSRPSRALHIKDTVNHSRAPAYEDHPIPLTLLSEAPCASAVEHSGDMSPLL